MSKIINELQESIEALQKRETNFKVAAIRAKNKEIDESSLDLPIKELIGSFNTCYEKIGSLETSLKQKEIEIFSICSQTQIRATNAKEEMYSTSKKSVAERMGEICEYLLYEEEIKGNENGDN